jgi:Putative threonine efflux protein
MNGAVSKMDITFLIRGFVIGLSIAAPIGPINVLCIRRTLAEGRLFGIVSGLGGATGDAIYGCVAGFGLTSHVNRNDDVDTFRFPSASCEPRPEAHGRLEPTSIGYV